MNAEVGEATNIGLGIVVGCVMLLVILWCVLPWLLKN